MFISNEQLFNALVTVALVFLYVACAKAFRTDQRGAAQLFGWAAIGWMCILLYLVIPESGPVFSFQPTADTRVLITMQLSNCAQLLFLVASGKYLFEKRTAAKYIVFGTFAYIAVAASPYFLREHTNNLIVHRIPSVILAWWALTSLGFAMHSYFRKFGGNFPRVTPHLVVYPLFIYGLLQWGFLFSDYPIASLGVKVGVLAMFTGLACKFIHLVGLYRMSATFDADYAEKRTMFNRIEYERKILKHLAHEYRQTKPVLLFDLHRLESAVNKGDHRSLRETTVSVISRLEQVNGLLESYNWLRKSEAERQSEFVPRAYNVNAFIDAAILALRIGFDANNEFVRQYCAAPTVFCEATSLAQIFHNIVKNAVEATSGSHMHFIEVTTRIIRNDANVPTSVEVRIRNNGPSIEHIHLKNIFDEGFTTKEGGSGIGLAIVRSLTHQMQGTVTVENESVGPNKGVTFIVTLPFTPSTVNHHQRKRRF